MNLDANGLFCYSWGGKEAAEAAKAAEQQGKGAAKA